jgi:hypothetical protein
VNDIAYLRRLARRLKQRIAHLQPVTERAWIYCDACRSSARASKLMLALSGFEVAALMATHYERLKQVRAEIAYLQGE